MGGGEVAARGSREGKNVWHFNVQEVLGVQKSLEGVSWYLCVGDKRHYPLRLIKDQDGLWLLDQAKGLSVKISLKLYEERSHDGSRWLRAETQAHTWVPSFIAV